MNRLLELTQLFLKLGIIGFGGPAAHIAMMEDEVVTRRNWMTRDHFLDIVGATNLIPGPNSTEMTMHVGYHRAGWPGLIVAGSCFILPAVLITAALAWGYVQFGSLPQVAPFLIGIKPAILVIILGAVWKLGQKALKGWRLAVIGIGVLAAVFLGVNEVIALLGGGLIGMLWLRLSERWLGQAAALLLPIPGLRGGLAGHLQAGQPPNLWELFLFFLKIGSILYGSGYVLVALLEGGLVHDLGWLTQQQLLDAIAIGQFTPGPVLSTATFIGYLILGLPGAIVATAGIFLPSFIFVGLLNPIIPRLRQLSWTAAFLDAVNISAVALILAVLINLGRTTLTAWPAWVIAILATVATFRFKLSSAWVVLGGAVLGWLVSWLV
jgi:chromate transporter